MTLDNMTGITEGSYTGFCKSQLITCNRVKECNGVCPFEDALKHADKTQILGEFKEFCDSILWNSIYAERSRAIDMAIEALQTEPNKAVPPSLADVYKWERDIALSQLEEYGIGFAEKKRDDLVSVVRCKDCRFYWGNLSEDDTDEMYGECKWDSDEMPNEDDFCSYGERREEGV